MSFTFLRKAGTSASIVALVAACGAATGEDLITSDLDGGLPTTDGSVSDDATPQPDGAFMPDAGRDSGPSCKVGCTFDFECQMTCPPAPMGGVNCCDVGSGTCYAAATLMCGVTMPDASMD